jgi:hypothetical protein
MFLCTLSFQYLRYRFIKIIYEFFSPEILQHSKFRIYKFIFKILQSKFNILFIILFIFIYFLIPSILIEIIVAFFILNKNQIETFKYFIFLINNILSSIFYLLLILFITITIIIELMIVYKFNIFNCNFKNNLRIILKFFCIKKENFKTSSKDPLLFNSESLFLYFIWIFQIITLILSMLHFFNSKATFWTQVLNYTIYFIFHFFQNICVFFITGGFIHIYILIFNLVYYISGSKINFNLKREYNKIGEEEKIIEIFENKFSFKYILKFSKKEFSSENIYALEKLLKWRQNNSNNINIKDLKIFLETYIFKNCSFELNIQSTTRNHILNIFNIKREKLAKEILENKKNTEKELKERCNFEEITNKRTPEDISNDYNFNFKDLNILYIDVMKNVSDTFSRFSQSDEYLNFLKVLNEKNIKLIK